MTVQATAWSFSTLTKFERCPFITYLTLTKAKKPGIIKDSPGQRGIDTHNLAENYVKGNLKKLPAELKKFKGDFEKLRGDYKNDLVEVEGEWAFTIDWDKCDWKDSALTWLRVKIDALQLLTENDARVIDYKTGKSYGNELTHIMQGQLYTIATFMRFPKITTVETSFWYLDEGKKSKIKVYDRTDMIPLVRSYEQRATAMLGCTHFKAKPNMYNCKWCEYGVNVGSASCGYAIDPKAL